MAKRTAKEMLNVLMVRIKQENASDISVVTGHAAAGLDFLNDALLEITNSTNGRWYSLLRNRIFQTSQNAIVTVLTFGNLSGETITLTIDGTAVVLTEGVDFNAVTDNNTTATNIATAISAISNAITGEAQTNVVTARITTPANDTGISVVATNSAAADLTIELEANGLYALPSQYHSSLIIKNISQNRIIISDWSKVLDFDDPDEDSDGTTLVFTIENESYRFHPRPSAVDTIKERFWKIPDRLAANTDLYELPEFCEVAILTLAESNLWFFLDKSAKGDRLRILYQRSLLPDAQESNDEMLDRIMKMDASDANPLNPSGYPLAPPFLGSNFTRQY